MSSLAFESKSPQSPWAKIRAAIKANNTNNEVKVSPPPPKPSPSANLDTLNDDQALALLLKNETVAGLLQEAFNTRVEEHQQKLVQAYNQRLFELEEYTRNWRDTTKELWSAVSEGTFNPSDAQRETLGWKGPQNAAHSFNPEGLKAPQDSIEKELDPDGRVKCIIAKNSVGPHSSSHLNLSNWINSSGCGSKDFKSFGNRIRIYPQRIVFRHKNNSGKVTYRSFKSMESPIKNMNCGDMFMELTSSNVSLLGKAFCYLKYTRYRILPQEAFTESVVGLSATEIAFLYPSFFQAPTKRHIDILVLYQGKKKLISDFFAANINVSVAPKRLLIARPRYDIGGSISGAKFFDVGSGAYTTHQESG